MGTGDIPTPELLRAVYDAGYRGPCVLEIFSDRPARTAAPQPRGSRRGLGDGVILEKARRTDRSRVRGSAPAHHKTPDEVVLLQVIDAQPVGFALCRALDTTLGGVLAVGAHALLRRGGGSSPR